jgi:hypothetical protein
MRPMINNKQVYQESKFQVSNSNFVNANIFLGYGGYVPGVKSENVYGQTYGKTSFASSGKTFGRGMDQPAHLKYNTSMK